MMESETVGDTEKEYENVVTFNMTILQSKSKH